MTIASKSKILLVDDDAELLREVKSHLEKLGYGVVTSSDGRVSRQTMQDGLLFRPSSVRYRHP